MHYPLDVVAAVLLGVPIVSLGLLVLESDKVHHSKRLASLLEKILKASHLPQVL
jgi:membrane-associated phospholipid phosphatase